MTDWKKAYIIAGILDALDYIGGFIPIAGDVLDFIGMLLLYPMIGNYALINLAEFIPSVDLIPTFLISVYMAQKKIEVKK